MGLTAAQATAAKAAGAAPAGEAASARLKVQWEADRVELQELADDLRKAVVEKDERLEALEEVKEQIQAGYELRLSEKEDELDEMKKENDLYVM